MRAIMPPDSAATPTTAGDDAHTLSPTALSARIVLFGMHCRFSALVLRRLLRGGADVRAVLLPGPPTLTRPLQVGRPSSLPMAGAAVRVTVDALADRHAIPLFQVGQLASAASLDVVRGNQPDLIAVACYPTRIPADMRQVARLGAYNIHPSLLPDKRGPDPLFWTFHDGGGVAGVTVHELTGRFDAGAIAAQDAWPLSDGTTEADLERTAAERGAELLLEVAQQALAGTLQLHDQAEASATWAPWPTAEDFSLNAGMSARRAFNFVCGVRERGEPLRMVVDGVELRVVEALRYHADPLRSADAPAGVTQLPFRDGVVLARVAPLTAAAASATPHSALSVGAR
jgi:methionyl-tRNA formyltransferase